MEHLYLTRRNLLTLLNKLDRNKNGGASACSIIKCDNSHPQFPNTSPMIMVTALEDSVYYVDRKPGRVWPEDEPKEEYGDKEKDN